MKVFSQLENAQLENLAADPASPPKGQIYFNTTTNKFKFYDGTIWQSLPAASANLAVATKSANYTLTTADDVILGQRNGGAFTLTLPTAVGNTGKVFYMKVVDGNDANRLTITPNGAETIDGLGAYILIDQYQSVTIISDGSGWNIL